MRSTGVLSRVWTAFVVVAVVLGSAVAAAAQGSAETGLEVATVTTGTLDGRIWLRVELLEPFPTVDESFSAAVAFSVFTPDRVHLSGNTQIHAGIEDTAGFCEPDSTACGVERPVVTSELSVDRMTVTFFLTAPTDLDVDPETLTFRVRTFSQTAEDASGPAQVAFPADDVPIPFDATEADPDATTTAEPTTTELATVTPPADRPTRPEPRSARTTPKMRTAPLSSHRPESSATRSGREVWAPSTPT